MTYGTAKDIKNQAASARRMSTSLRRMVESLKFQQRLDASQVPPLSDKDIDQLHRASAILGRFGAKTATAAKQAAEKEKAKELAIQKARAEASRIMAGWPAAGTVLDKVALIMGNQAGRNLRSDLESEREDYAWDFNYWFDNATSEIPASAAYHAVLNNKPIAEVMSTAELKIAEFKTRREVQELAARWEEKIANQTPTKSSAAFKVK